jgi:taurine dioxygenase
LPGGIGAEVAGVDIRRLPEQADELRGILDRHQLILLRGQTLEPAEHIAFAGVFGTVADERQDGDRHALLTNTNEKAAPLNALEWHADYAFTPYQYTTISLYAVEISGSVSGTQFTSESQALDRLPAVLRNRLEGLDAFHVATRGGKSGVDFEEEWEGIAGGGYDGVVTKAPAVQPHPRTGTPLLHVSAMFTAGFAGVGYKEGRELLAEVFETLYDPAHVYAFDWNQDDLILWDNVALQHARGEVPKVSAGGGARALRRVVTTDHFAELIDYVPDLRATFSRSLVRG